MRRRPIHPPARRRAPNTRIGNASIPVDAMADVPTSETEGPAPPAPPPPPADDPLEPAPPFALVATAAALPAAVLPLTVATLAAPGGGGGGVPFVTPQVGVVWPAWTSVGVRSPHE